jgi:hypothetical protein
VEPFFQWASPNGFTALPAKDSSALTWWTTLATSIKHDDLVVLPPGPRNKSHDFVVKGLRVRPEHIEVVREQWGAFQKTAGLVPPADAFQGRGIAILSGSGPYLIPSLICVKALRRAGCRLPVELWFPENEVLGVDLTREVEELGARIQVFPFPEVLGKVCGRNVCYSRSTKYLCGMFVSSFLFFACACGVSSPFILLHYRRLLDYLLDYLYYYCSSAQM